jgi:predicted AlkP superfamily pyrophosphatase or phosphodiesterase
MILHYLGLDHIGHVSGPFSSLVKPKLQEMDEIIAFIQSYVSKWVILINYSIINIWLKYIFYIMIYLKFYFNVQLLNFF